ncbi:MAG TPA: nucleotidyltransferase family protein [Burkholderiales bacterium]|nr:nucleotidyltransferase family protein [Burkholderiales bacterium]
MKAMILAAGRGERLRPLTAQLPKALVAVAGRPLIAWQLERLARAGFHEVVINVSWLGEAIVERLGDGAAFGLAIAYSREAEPLESAGGIAQARRLLGEAPFALVNADIWCDYDLGRLRGRRLGRDLAHLVLTPNPAHHPAGDFSLDGDRAGNAAAPRYTYTGISLIDPALVAPVASGAKAPLAPLLRAAADAGRLSGELHAGLWRDAGTAERLAELETLVAEGGRRTLQT